MPDQLVAHKYSSIFPEHCFEHFNQNPVIYWDFYQVVPSSVIKFLIKVMGVFNF